MNNPIHTASAIQPDLESQIIQSGTQAGKLTQDGKAYSNRSLSTCSHATACAANLAMVYLGTMLNQYQTAKILNSSPLSSCSSEHPDLAEPISKGIVLATGVFAAVLALPSAVGLIKGIVGRNSN